MSAPRPGQTGEARHRRGSVPELAAPFAWRREGGALWIEATLAAGRAAFSTRLGGASAGPYRSLNLGILTGDDPQLVARNRESLADLVERSPESIALGLQVHGADVQCHRGPPQPNGYVRRGAPIAEADAQLTDSRRVTPLVLVADCIPLALSTQGADGTPGAVAVLHCGWRGVAAGLVGRAVEALCRLAGARPEFISAAQGPGIGPCCYEVGPEVLRALRAGSRRDELRPGTRLDLPAVIGRELERAGVRPHRILHAGLCTACQPQLFFSHRRDGGVTGRQAGLAWLEQ